MAPFIIILIYNKREQKSHLIKIDLNLFLINHFKIIKLNDLRHIFQPSVDFLVRHEEKTSAEIAIRWIIIHAQNTWWLKKKQIYQNS